jgi:RimJ/RimL family protein N-acetyltransferase
LRSETLPNTAIPALETERLILRGNRLSDFPALAELWGDTNVVRHISGKPFSPEECWARLMRYVGHWALQGYGFWAIEEKASGRYVGEAGLADFKRGLTPSLDGTPEVGWVLASWAHGKGYATEAVRAACAWGERKFGETPLACIIAPEHKASINVATKCGFREYARTTYKGSDTIIFRREAVLQLS